jgi:hypothetical protein
VEDLTAIAGKDRDGQVQYRLAKLYRKLGDKQREREALLAFRQLQTASMETGGGELLQLDQERDTARHDATGP